MRVEGWGLGVEGLERVSLCVREASLSAMLLAADADSDGTLGSAPSFQTFPRNLGSPVVPFKIVFWFRVPLQSKQKPKMGYPYDKVVTGLPRNYEGATGGAFDRGQPEFVSVARPYTEGQGLGFRV